MLCLKKVSKSETMMVLAIMKKLDQGTWLCRTLLDTLLVDFGPYWTILDQFGSFCLFGPVYLDQSIWTCLFGPVYLELSTWTCLFGPVFFDLSLRPLLFGPVYLRWTGF